MELANVCQTEKASDLIVDLKNYFGVKSDRELIEVALTLTEIVVDKAVDGEVVIVDGDTDHRTTIVLKDSPKNVIDFRRQQRRSFEVISAHRDDDCA